MTDVPAHVIANFTIEDPDTYRQYEKGFFSILKRHGGEFITFDDETKTLEGGAPIQGRTVIFKFPTKAAAEAWYADSDYQALSEHRRKGTTLNFLTIVHGLPPR